MSQPDDIDEIVSSFLSELNTIGDGLGLARDQPVADDVSIQPSSPPASLKSPTYRNIDILFMHDVPFSAGRGRMPEQGSPARTSDPGQRTIPAVVWAYLQSQYLACWSAITGGTALERLRRRRR